MEKTDSDLISVVIPVYNAAPYLERCLDSVIKQDYPNLEVILVNDGSTDNSLSVCEKYTRLYPGKITLINQSNAGASIARKNGIEAAAGEYLVFADSDDYVSPHYVSALHNALKNTSTDIALCPMKRLAVGESPVFQAPAQERVMARDELFRRFFRYEFWGYPGACYRKSLFDGVNFPEATVNEDYYVKAQIFARVGSAAYIDTPLYFYEQHSGSLSKQPLSLRALGEFDNALATWQFVSSSVPRYSRQAHAIASEAACKWLGALNKTKDCQFAEYKLRIKEFIKNNIAGIMLNPNLLWKIKLMIIRNLLWAVN